MKRDKRDTKKVIDRMEKNHIQYAYTADMGRAVPFVPFPHGLDIQSRPRRVQK